MQVGDAVCDVDTHLDSGIGLSKGDECGCNEMALQCCRRRDLEPAGGVLRVGGNLVLRPIHLLQNSIRSLQENPSFLGEVTRACRAVYEADTEMLFERLDTLGDGAG